jgi:predicted ATP-grasp superfamily ATP-dependent carboligase
VNAVGIWPVDFNPRIPASAEIFELASLNTSSTISFSVIRTHVELTLQRVIPAISQSKRNQMIGKSILFCHHPEGMVFDERKFQQALKFYRHGDGKLKQPAWISDIPQLGTRIPFQEPIMSLFVRGATEPQVFQRLRRFAAQVR